MSKLVIHLEQGPIGWHDFSSLSAVPDQKERALRSFGGLAIGSVPLRALLYSATARYVTFRSDDGYSTALSWASLDDCFVAYRLGALPLPRKLGGPFRAIIVGASRHSCLKYVDAIELGEQPRPDLRPSCAHAAPVDHWSE